LWNRSSRGAIAVVLALLLAPGVAHADAKPHLLAAWVIALATRDPAVGPLFVANKGAHWEVVFDAPSRTWTAVLEPRGKHNVLASFKIDDSTSAILNTTVTPKLGAPRLTSAEAVTLARRSGALRSWIAQYPGVEATATTATARRWRRPASATRR
jgi:hypothetical protein